MPLIVVLVLAAIGLALLLPLNGWYPWWMLILAGALFVVWQATPPDAVEHDRVIIPIVAAICALGILEISRIDPYLGRHQTGSLIAGLAIVVLGQRLFVQYRKLAHVTYPWVLVSLALFVALHYFGQEVNGARLWFHIGPFNAQPVEGIKLFMVFFMAAYLADKGEEIAAVRWSEIGRYTRLMLPLVLGWGVSIVTLVLQHDVGMAALFLGIFLVMLYVAARRLDIVIAFLIVFALGAWFAVHNLPYVQTRIGVWLDPWNDPLGRGYQAEQGFFSLAAGGLLGTGYHQGHPGFIPDAATDYTFAAWAEEFGLIGGLALIALYTVLVVRGFGIAFAAADRFTMLLATGFSATLGIQVFVIVGGVVGLLPLTGITLPFFSYGGSSIVANLIMLNFLWLFSRGCAEPSSAPDTPASL
ncbi:MAG TPA: FtsW/RodA/SpoVE family cell cycle protein [Candidatus Eremiobacteraceae bacterium]|nr:FtsW/RodA/SpoVE family cell cycle protein [Candidatus Eremiobacteraceae bacterium]